MIYAKNLPLWERALRILVGGAIIASVWLAAPSPLVSDVSAAVGYCLVSTRLSGFCPGCAMIGRRPVRA